MYSPNNVFESLLSHYTLEYIPKDYLQCVRASAWYGMCSCLGCVSDYTEMIILNPYRPSAYHLFVGEVIYRHFFCYIQNMWISKFGNDNLLPHYLMLMDDYTRILFSMNLCWFLCQTVSSVFFCEYYSRSKLVRIDVGMSTVVHSYSQVHVPLTSLAFNRHWALIHIFLHLNLTVFCQCISCIIFLIMQLVF